VGNLLWNDEIRTIHLPPKLAKVSKMSEIAGNGKTVKVARNVRIVNTGTIGATAIFKTIIPRLIEPVSIARYGEHARVAATGIEINSRTIFGARILSAIGPAR
jgi:hypothetical protein